MKSSECGREVHGVSWTTPELRLCTKAFALDQDTITNETVAVVDELTEYCEIVSHAA